MFSSLSHTDLMTEKRLYDSFEPEILLIYGDVLLVNDGKGNKLAGGNVQHLGSANATGHCNRCVLPTVCLGLPLVDS